MTLGLARARGAGGRLEARTLRIADLYCGAGGAAMGIYRACEAAGVDCLITGVDIEPQPRYPAFHNNDYARNISFVQGNALEFDLSGFDAVWASPPCQAFTRSSTRSKRERHADLVPSTRDMLARSGLPYIIENVIGAPLRPDAQLCGQAFGLRTYRHRIFESNILLLQPPHEKHAHVTLPAIGVYQTFNKAYMISLVKHRFRTVDGRIAMGIGWMNRDELAEAIPPAYSEFLWSQLLLYISASTSLFQK